MVQSVERTLNILEELSRIKDESKGIGVLELSRILKLNSSTVHNLLKTLVQRQYVEKIEETKKYRLGPNCYNLVKEKLITNKLAKVAEPSLLNLSQKVNESIVLAVYHQGERFVISEVESQQPLKVDMSFSLAPDAYGSVTGRILLSQLTDEELKDYLKRHGFPGEKWNGINDFASLKKELTKIKQEGMAIRQDKQICALAVPIIGERERLIASLGIYLPSVRFKGKHKREIIKGLKDATKEISIRFNY